jgi:RHH-type transcriptional regulator, rel operon repressor / antitoxin RelB
MLALRLPPEIEQRLDALAKKTGRSKSYYAREAILRQIEDIEDTYLARRRLKRGGSRVTLESLERDLAKRIARPRQKRLLELVGKLEWDESYDTKAERQRK